jgi:hypothetical protein
VAGTFLTDLSDHRRFIAFDVDQSQAFESQKGLSYRGGADAELRCKLIDLEQLTRLIRVVDDQLLYGFEYLIAQRMKNPAYHGLQLLSRNATTCYFTIIFVYFYSFSSLCCIIKKGLSSIRGLKKE